MSTRRFVILLAVPFALSAALVVSGMLARQGQRAEHEKTQGFAETYESLWPAPEFSYADQGGTRVTPASLRGQVWVANFVFTQCRTVCPLITTKMVQLARRLPGANVRFVSFSVDPEHDTPEVLAAYAQRWAPDEPRWSLLATDEATLPALMSGFRVMREKSTDPVDPIVHSAAFVLVDAAGMVRGVFNSDHGEDFAALERGVRLLLGGGRIDVAALPTDGPGLYHALSCANCHERAELAPALVGFAGTRRELDNGLVAIADAAYLREAIMAPHVKRVRGYPLRMPSYEGLVDEARLASLVAWLGTRAGSVADASATVAVDPVCQMEVRVVADTPRLVRDGQTHYFCSEFCRDKLAAGR